MAKFELGELAETKAIYERRREDRYFDLFVRFTLDRYKACDWGDTCPADAALNDYAVEHDERIFASYIYDVRDVLNYLEYHRNEEIEKWVPLSTQEKLEVGLKIWIITEWDRSVTTILFPDEY